MAGVNFDGIRPYLFRGLDLIPLGVDEETDKDPSSLEPLDGSPERFGPFDHIESSLGGQFLSPFRNQGDDLRL